MILVSNYKNVKYTDNLKYLKNILAFCYALIYNRLNNKENKQNKLKANNNI